MLAVAPFVGSTALDSVAHMGVGERMLVSTREQLDKLSDDALAVKRLSILTPDRRAKLTPLSGTAEVVPVVNSGDPRGFV